MSQSFHNVNIQSHLDKMEELIAEVNNVFGDLSAQQLGWKPTKGQWSIRECLDHIMMTNKQYYPQFDKIADGRYEPTFWQKMPAFWHSFWGGQLVEYLGPEVKRKSKSPAIFRPTAGRLSQHIVKDFTDSLKLLTRKMIAMDHVDHTTVIITSPVSRLVTYSLYDTLQIVVGHAERHVNQAKRVTQQPLFPVR
ncbi:MAG: DinB family protein [Imperialibacter sp.]|uniref:DinB family protein n=1 Tax=Imperialibacter sp. TaxID=2038411 RepID=UPI0032EE5FEE